MAPTPDVSVVVSTHNRARRLKRLLDALRGQDLPGDRFEVVVVNNHSADDTASVLERALARGDLPLRAVDSDAPKGPGPARDKGWRLARAGLIAFTDDDCVPAPAWLAAGLRAAELHRGAVIQGRTEPDPSELDQVGPFSRTMSIASPDPSWQTCNVFYPRSVLERVDGFDTDGFPTRAAEDADLAGRARASGAWSAFAADALVFHAVNQLGAAGKLRVAASWTPVVSAYAKYPDLKRAHTVRGIFWKPTHLRLGLAVAGLFVGRRSPSLGALLLLPYAHSVYGRIRTEGGGPLIAPYLLVHDLVEVQAIARGAVRYRTLVI